jgi:glycine/D-amino acid oxidase-like deaminating enzyme
MEANARSADVIVVGAGVTGLAIAHHLLQGGLSVRIVDRAGVGAGASGVQPGGVRRQWATAANCLLAQESYEFYLDLPARLQTRVPATFTACGYAFVAHSKSRLAELAAAVAVQQRLGIPSAMLSPAETATVVPELNAERISGAAWCGDDGYFDRAQAPVEAFAEAVLAGGGELVLGQVEALEPAGAGWRLRLEGGRQLMGERIVVAAAHETSSLLATVGVEVPIAAESRHLFFSRPVPARILEPLVIASELGFAAKQLADGRVLASDLRAAGSPAENAGRWRQTIRSGIEALLPRLDAISFSELVSGVYDVTPDHDPILGSVAGAPGVWLAAGFNGHGFMLAPAVGRLVAESVLETADRDSLLDSYSLSRFAGSPRRDVETQVI